MALPRLHALLLAVLLLLCVPLSAPAAPEDAGGATVDEIPGDEADVRQELIETELAGTQRKYELELTINPRLEDLLSKDYVRFPVRFKYGITSNWETFLLLNTFLDNISRADNRNGMSDVTVGTKYRWKRLLRPHVETATAFSIKIPTGSNDDISGGYIHYLPQIIFTKTLPSLDFTRLNASLGFDVVSGPPRDVEGRPDNSMIVSLGATYPSGSVNYSLETIYVTTEVGGGTVNSVFITPGFLWGVPKGRNPLPGDWRFGLGFRFGLADAEEDFALITRLKWDFPLKYKVPVDEIINKGGELLNNLKE